MLTIYDIAKACGCSPATVSKALNPKGYKDVSLRTVERIQQAAKEMGYYPNSQARALINRKFWNIGVLCEDGAKLGFRHHLFNEVLEGFKRYVEYEGYDITIISKHVAGLDMSYLGHGRYRNMDGVMVAFADFSDPDIQELLHSDIPCVTFDYKSPDAYSVTTDSDEAMEQIVDYLYQLGHRKIVYIHGENVYITWQRIEGLRKALSKRGIELTREMLAEGKYYSDKTGYKVMNDILDGWREATAVIVCDDYSALGALRAVLERGLTVPDDISLVGFDGLELTALVNPPLTTIRQDSIHIGEILGTELVKSIEYKQKNRRNRPGKEICVSPIFQKGGSCKEVS